PLLALSVQDNGPGIAPDIMPRIFEPYFTTQPRTQGTGLGLPIVQRLLKESRSALHAHSHPGTGTEFTVYLPSHLTTPHPPHPPQEKWPTATRLSEMRAKIIITPKKAGFDPKGKPLQNALAQMGYQGIGAVHVGKYLEVELTGTDREGAQRQLDDACHKFLS